MDLLAQSQTSKERKRYKLTGHSLVGDKRTTPIRGDLADIKLAGKLFAPHYAVPLQRSIVTATAAIREFPDAKSMGASELVYGEGFAVLDVAGDWAWGYGVHDDYLGYVRMESLGDPVEPTHVVTATGTLLFDKPNIRSAVMMRLPMGARLVSGGDSECGQFLLCGDAFVPKTHVEEIGKVRESAVDLSERLVGQIGPRLVLENAADQPRAIRLADFVHRPADADVLDPPAREIGHRSIGGDLGQGGGRGGHQSRFPLI